MDRKTGDYMDRLGGLSGTPRHRILTGRIRARTRDRQMNIWPTPRGRESASVKECDGRLGTPDKTPGDLFSSFGRHAACAPRSGTSGGVVGLRTRKARLRPGGAYAIPPADTPPHSSPSTPRRPRLSRTRSGGGLPFGLWRRLSEGDGQVLRKRNTALPCLTQKPSCLDLGCGRSPRYCLTGQ